jgi:hypothetical protein
MTDWKARCATLIDKIDYTWGDIPDDVLALIDRTRAELAQPEPETSRLRYCDVHGQQPENAWGCPECVREMRHQLAQPKPEGPSDEELDYLWAEIDGGPDCCAWRPFARAVLARFGRPAIEPVPEPEAPTNREIEQWADATPDVPREALDPDSACWHRSFSSEKFCNTIRSALEYWCVTPQAQCPAIKPVPVAEQPWERDGWCDAEGRCWMVNELLEWAFRKQYKSLDSYYFYGYTHLLPHYALPVPTSQEIL